LAARSFRDFSASGVVGDARRASVEKGERMLAVCRDAIAAVLRSDEAWS
jgi:creatinine amidohydrolase